MTAPYQLGTEVYFTDHAGTTRTGRVVGVEYLDQPNRWVGPQGWNFLVKTCDSVDAVHFTAIVGRVEPPSYIASLYGY